MSAETSQRIVMNRKLKLALAALLGFSTACSTVKNAPKRGTNESETPTDSVRVVPPIVVMYGVRTPTQPIPISSNPELQQEAPTAEPSVPAAQLPENGL